MNKFAVHHLLKGFIAVLVSTGSPAPGAHREVSSPAQSESAWEAPASAARRSNPVPVGEASTARGKELYLQECAACHGFTGKGDGAKVTELNVKPSDLSKPALQNQSDGALFWKISEGKAPMLSFRLRFSEKERWTIIHYVRTLASQQSTQVPTPTGASESGGAPAPQAQSSAPSSWQAPAQASRQVNPVPVDQSSLARGKQLYTQECADCHGATGKGDGPGASDLKANPANLSSPTIQQQTDGTLFWKLSAGKKPMPAFEKKLPEKDRWMIIGYLRTLAQGKAAGSKVNNDLPQRAAKNSNLEMLSAPYLHVLINPLPIYGLGAGTLALLIGLLMRSRPAQVVALCLIFVFAASAWPAYFLGHKAYGQVHPIIDGDGQAWLSLHMHRADRWIYLFYALALSAVVAALIPRKFPKSALPLVLFTLSLALICMGAGGWIAKAGGRIRHSEFRGHSGSSSDNQKTRQTNNTDALGPGDQTSLR